MISISDAETAAHAAMSSVRPDLADSYAKVISFLMTFPSYAALGRSKAATIGSIEYIRIHAASFAASRNPKAPQGPTTVPDEMVSVILNEYFDIDESQLERVKQEHSLSMGAENLVGELLERYLATVLEPFGWVWCSGAMVKAVDFIKPPTGNQSTWRLLQVKNRDNSENSSSSAIRVGTTIEKWFRTFSRKAGSNWAAFPDPTLRQHLSEQAFKAFVRSYLSALKSVRD